MDLQDPNESLSRVASKRSSIAATARTFIVLTAIFAIVASAWLYGIPTESASTARTQPRSIQYLLAQSAYAEEEASTIEARFSKLNDSASKGLTPSAPFWLRLEDTVDAANTSSVIELKMLRARSIDAFCVESSQSMDPQLRRLSAQNTKGGIAVYLTRSESQCTSVIARIDSPWPSRPKLKVWPSSDFERSVETFNRFGGALFGTFVTIAAFSAIIALRNRDLTFLYFALWLLTTLRLIAINGGWDPVWLGISIQGDLTSTALRSTLALHSLITAVLFRSLFSDALPTRWDTTALTLVTYVLAAISVGVVFVDHETALSMIWISGGIGLVLLLKLLWRLLGTTPTNVVRAYAFSWICLIFGMLGDISYAAGILQIPISASAIGTCLSAFVMATAMAEKIRAERED